MATLIAPHVQITSMPMMAMHSSQKPACRATSHVFYQHSRPTNVCRSSHRRTCRAAWQEQWPQMEFSLNQRPIDDRNADSKHEKQIALEQDLRASIHQQLSPKPIWWRLGERLAQGATVLAVAMARWWVDVIYPISDVCSFVMQTCVTARSSEGSNGLFPMQKAI